MAKAKPGDRHPLDTSLERIPTKDTKAGKPPSFRAIRVFRGQPSRPRGGLGRAEGRLKIWNTICELRGPMSLFPNEGWDLLVTEEAYGMPVELFPISLSRFGFFPVVWGNGKT